MRMHVARILTLGACVFALDACHILSREAACSTSADCPSSLPICDAATGFCTSTGGSSEGEGSAAEGEGAPGEGEGAIGEGEGAVGEGEGAVGEGEGATGEGEGAVGEGEGEGGVTGEGEGEGVKTGEGEGEGEGGVSAGEGEGEGEGEGGGLPDPNCPNKLDDVCDPQCVNGAGVNIDPDCVCGGIAGCNNQLVVGNFTYTTDQSTNTTEGGCIQGNVTIKADGTMPPNIRGVIGNVTVQASTVSQLSLHGLGCVGGALKIVANTGGVASIAGNGPSLNVRGDVVIDNNPLLQSVSPLPLVGTVGGALSITNDNALTTIDMPSNFAVKGNLTLSNDARVGSINRIAPGGVSGNVFIDGNQLLTFLPNATVGPPVSVGGSINLDDNASLDPALAVTFTNYWQTPLGGNTSDNGECRTAPQFPTTSPFNGNSAIAQSRGLVGSCGGFNDEDVFEFDAPPTAGTLAVTVSTTNANLDLVLYARTVCGDVSTERGCSNGAGLGQPESLTIPFAANETFFVVVDADPGGFAGGTYKLTFNVQ